MVSVFRAAWSTRVDRRTRSRVRSEGGLAPLGIGRAAGAGSKPRVLVVDDDDSLRRALVRTLRLAGFDVEAFRSAETLLSRGAVERDRCLVLDVSVLGIDGIALARNLRAEGRSLPTIFITAFEHDEIAARFACFAPVAVLYKPFHNEELLDAVARACSEP